jgi:LacI family transcriptional regulator
MAKIGIREVAEACGVSVSTVSNALSELHHARVKPETRQHIRDVAARLGYAPNRLASGLRNQRSFLLGFVSDQIASTPFAGDMILGAQDAAYERGWLVMVVDSGGNPSLEERQASTLLQHQVDGIVYAKMFHQRVRVPAEIKGVPVVLLDAVDIDGRFPAVVPDEVAAARTAVRELTDAGHRRIGFINTDDDHPAPVRRLQGYREGLAAAGLAFDPDLVAFEPGGKHGRIGAGKLLNLAERPTGIFCYYDHMAFGVYETAAALGLSIPTDLSVVSIDNFEIIADGLGPGLTSVALPHYEMGRWAVNRLLDEIENPDEARPSPPMLLECPIVRRASVAAPRTSTP